MAGVENGELLARAAGQTEALITMDRKLERQQNLSALTFGIVLVVDERQQILDSVCV